MNSMIKLRYRAQNPHTFLYKHPEEESCQETESKYFKIITITYYNCLDVLFLLFRLTFLNCLENMGQQRKLRWGTWWSRSSSLRVEWI